MKPILDFGVFQQIKDYEAFKRVRVSFDTIEWECGVDLPSCQNMFMKNVKPVMPSIELAFV